MWCCLTLMVQGCALQYLSLLGPRLESNWFITLYRVGLCHIICDHVRRIDNAEDLLLHRVRLLRILACCDHAAHQ